MKIQFALLNLIAQNPENADKFQNAAKDLEVLLANSPEEILDIWEFVRDTTRTDLEVHTNPEHLFVNEFGKSEQFDEKKTFHSVNENCNVFSFDDLEGELSPINWALIIAYVAETSSN